MNEDSKTALAIYGQFDQLQRAALALHKSGFFPDVKSEAQAVVKVMAGAELGVPPFASMTGVHIIKGKPVLGANVLATLVKNDPRYDYHVKTATDEKCTIEWVEGDTITGVSSFTIDEAKQAGLLHKDNWKKYPSDMLFARAISRGVKRFTPGVFGGAPVYTPDEMGIDDDGEVIDTSFVEVDEEQVEEQVEEQPEPQEKIHPKKNGRPLSPEDLKRFLGKKAFNYEMDNRTASQNQRGLVAGMLGTSLDGSEVDRHAVTYWLTEGVESLNDVADGMILAMLDWLDPEKTDDGYVPNPHAIVEARSVLRQAGIDQGQQEMELD